MLTIRQIKPLEYYKQLHFFTIPRCYVVNLHAVSMNVPRRSPIRPSSLPQNLAHRTLFAPHCRLLMISQPTNLHSFSPRSSPRPSLLTVFPHGITSAFSCDTSASLTTTLVQQRIHIRLHRTALDHTALSRSDSAPHLIASTRVNSF
jgi:hypothetical protein